MKDFSGLMKQAKDMQSRMQKVQEEIQGLEERGESGAGLVRVTMTGRHDVKNIQIDPALLSEDVEILEDLIAAAVNDAVRRVESATQEKMKAATGGLSMPPGFNLGI